jgi:hypothetical protein
LYASNSAPECQGGEKHFRVWRRQLSDDALEAPVGLAVDEPSVPGSRGLQERIDLGPGVLTVEPQLLYHFPSLDFEIVPSPEGFEKKPDPEESEGDQAGEQKDADLATPRLGLDGIGHKIASGKEQSDAQQSLDSGTRSEKSPAQRDTLNVLAWYPYDRTSPINL